MTGKSQNWELFGLHKLVATPTPTPTPTNLPGDANRDNKVDVSDLGILAANYGLTVNATWSMGDFNNDGTVACQRPWGSWLRTTGPEPAAASILTRMPRPLAWRVNNEKQETPVVRRIGLRLCGSAADRGPASGRSDVGEIERVGITFIRVVDRLTAVHRLD